MEKTIKSKIIYKGKVVNLRVDEVVLSNKRKTKREIVEHKGSVCAVILTKKKKIILVGQYRKPVEKVLWELPAGVIEKGETPLTTVKREIAEEVGSKCYRVKKLIEFYPSPGFLDEKLYLFLAYESKRFKSNQMADENIKIKEVILSDAVKMVKAGKIQDAKTIIGILWIKLISDVRPQTPDIRKK